MQLVRLADCPPQPWRNGGGRTRELLRWPAALAPGTAADEAWIVRVSVAEITADGPFSAYPGIERWFAVLQGAGVRLALPEGEQVRREGEDALHFAGEAAPGCALLGGPTQDLNLMVRRAPMPGSGASSPGPVHTGGTGRTGMRRALPGSVQRGRLPWRALYAHAETRLRVEEEMHELPAGTLAWSDAGVAQAWEVLETGAAYWMSFEP